jgi:hypothetical protein
MLRKVLEFLNRLLYRLNPEHHQMSLFGPDICDEQGERLGGKDEL